MANKNAKTPRRLKGFNDFFAEDMQIREFVIKTFKETFEKYGYEPLETPALEYAELMLGQSGSEAEKQYYQFKDPGGRDVMLKYEVMIAMTRAVAQNINNLPMPYKRYQIQRVWRAENTQKGRYREFTQCDADTIGTTSMTADAEYIQMGLEITGKLGFENYVARISNRKFLEGLAEYLGLEEDKFYGFCMSLDKLLKIGKENVVAEMIDRRAIPEEIASKTVEMTDTAQYENMSFREVIESFRSTVGSNETGKEALDELEEIVTYLEIAEVDPKQYTFDTSLARGLASYTGPIWEFEVKDGGVGSIAGCGRYDKAIGKYINQDIPATGGSFGIERMTDIIKDRNMMDLGQTTTDVLVTQMDESLFEYVLKTARELRSNGVKTMLYPEAIKLGKQFQYADRKGIRWVVVIGQDEVDSNQITLKDLSSGENKVLSIDEAVSLISKS